MQFERVLSILLRVAHRTQVAERCYVYFEAFDKRKRRSGGVEAEERWRDEMRVLRDIFTLLDLSV